MGGSLSSLWSGLYVGLPGLVWPLDASCTTQILCRLSFATSYGFRGVLGGKSHPLRDALYATLRSEVGPSGDTHLPS